MLATVVALHLILAQAPAAEPPPPGEQAAPLPDRPAERPEGAPGYAIEPAAAPGVEGAEPAAPAEAAAPAPAPQAEEEELLKPGREPPRRATLRARSVAKSALNPIPSLLSAEPLGGRSALSVWAGWASLGAGWAQGVTNEDDLGVLADFDWSTTELRLSAFYRRPMGRVGAVDIASRLRAGWYADFGADWFHDDNLADRGIEFVPGLVLSTRGAGGVFSLAGDLPIAVTLWRHGGIVAAPRLAFGYETLLYGDLIVGIRVAGAYRAGTDDAPMSEGRGLLELTALVGWRLF